MDGVRRFRENPCMVVYNLSCDNAHRFEGWFGSLEDYTRQESERLLSCPVCSSQSVVRQPSAPYVTSGAVATVEQIDAATGPAMAEAVRARMIEHLFKSTEDVGEEFPEEARRMHYKESPARSIRGKASMQDVNELREEGIEVVAISSLPVPPENMH
jgi:hypothetical protein